METWGPPLTGYSGLSVMGLGRSRKAGKREKLEAFGMRLSCFCAVQSVASPSLYQADGTEFPNWMPRLEGLTQSH